MPPKLRLILAPLLILLAGLLAYQNSLHGQFVFDDLESIVNNPHIKHVWPLTYSMSTPPQSPIAARPVVSLTFAINYAMTGFNTLSYHLTNLAIHLACGLLVYALTRRTLLTPKLATRLRLTEPTPTYLATAGALLFTLHPLNNECVNYTMQRTESLMALFALLTLYCFTRAATRPKTGTVSSPSSILHPPSSISHLPSSLWLLAATLSCALGMGCKEVMVAAPLLVLFYDRLFLSPTWKSLLKHHWPAHLAIFSTYLVLAYILTGNPRSQTSNFSFTLLTPWNYLKTQAGVLVFYLRMVFFPHPLVIDYYDWPLAIHLRDVLPQALLILALLALTLYGLFRPKPHPLAIVGAFFFFVLAPTSSIIPLAGENASERRMYLPMAAICPALAIAAHLLLRRLIKTPQPRAKLEFTLTVAICFVMALADINHNELYHNDVALWEDTVLHRPHNGRAWANLGASYFRDGRYDDAIYASSRSIDSDPGLPTAYRNRAGALAKLGKYPQSLPDFRHALAIMDHAPTRAGYARALFETGQRDRAFHQYQHALHMDPDNPTIENDYGFTLAQAGQINAAIPHFKRALQLDPKLADAHFNLALADEAHNDYPAAVHELRQAIALQPQNPQSLDHLAWLLATDPDPKIRNPNDALDLAQRSLKLNHSDPATALDTLAAAQAATGDFNAAIQTATRAHDLASHSNPPLAHAIEHRLSLYQHHHPYQQPPRPTTTPTSRPTPTP